MSSANISVIRILVMIMTAFTSCGWCATLDGNVIDHLGATQPKARVTVRDSNRQVMREDTTGNDGRFHFENLRAGKYTVFVIAPCFSEVQKIIDVKADSEALRVEIKLGTEHKSCRGIDAKQ